MKKIVLALLMMALVPVLTFAHPGHGETDGYTIIHYFIEPMHAVVTYSILLGAFAYILYSRKKKQHN